METTFQPDRSAWKRIFKLIIPYVLIVGLFQLAAFSLLGLDITKQPRERLDTFQTFVVLLFDLCGTFLTIWLLCKYEDKKSFASLGFAQPSKRDVIYGLMLGFAIMLGGFIILLLTEQIRFQSIRFQPTDFLLSIGIFTAVAFTEELLLRGYVLGNLMASMNKYVALIISSVIFSVMHGANPHISWFGFTDLFIAGILLGLPYIYTRNLWFPIALHFSWNFFQGTIFGFNVSGQEFYSVITHSRDLDNIWNGGPFGFEGSVLSILFQVISIFIILMLFRKPEPVALERK